MPDHMVRGLLEQIASNIERGEENDCATTDKCVEWHGEFLDGSPVIALQKPGESEPAATFVNRILI